jgi:pyruvate/2-oxoglutarate dehydrogenase complex dihydrolipoamide acyltransferase (E2) component
MAINVVLEAVSEELEYVSVNRWYKQEGETVGEGEALVEVEGDKATYDIAAPAAGMVLKILAAVGDEVEVGATLATIEPA